MDIEVTQSEESRLPDGPQPPEPGSMNIEVLLQAIARETIIIIETLQRSLMSINVVTQQLTNIALAAQQALERDRIYENEHGSGA